MIASAYSESDYLIEAKEYFEKVPDKSEIRRCDGEIECSLPHAR